MNVSFDLHPQPGPVPWVAIGATLRARPLLDEVNVYFDPTTSEAQSSTVGLSNGNSESQKFWTK